MSFSLSVKDYTLAAGVPLVIEQPATFFQLMEATGDVDIRIRRAHSNIGDASGVQQGFRFGGPTEELFHAVEITSASAQTIKACFARGSADLGQLVGTVEVSSLTNNGTPTQASIATGADAQVLAANASRRFLMLQNIGAADVFYTIDGGTADANGFKLSPGAGVVLDAFTPTAAIRAYSASASTLAYCEA